MAKQSLVVPSTFGSDKKYAKLPSTRRWALKNEDGCTIASRVDDVISIENKGQRIVRTNYFDTENARSGFVYLSWNAGAGRVLLPDSRKEWLPEMNGETRYRLAWPVGRAGLAGWPGERTVQILAQQTLPYAATSRK